MLVRNIARRPRGVRRPPEIPFNAFEAMLASLSTGGVPQRIDSSIISHFRLGVAPEVMPSLRFLNLVDERGAPTERLNPLVAAYRTPGWPAELRRVVEAAYEPLFQMPLDRVTAGEFQEAFRGAYPTGGLDGLRKSIAFFLKAAVEAEIPVSPRVVRRRRGLAKRTGLESPPSNREAVNVLIDLLDPEVMSEEEQKAVVTLLLYLQEN